MRALSPRLVAQPKYPGSSAARSKATARCLSRLPCPAPSRLRHLRAPLPLLQRRHPQSLSGCDSPRRLRSVSRKRSILHPLSPPLPCWGRHLTPSPSLLTHTRIRRPVFFHLRSTTRVQWSPTNCITLCSTAASTTSGMLSRWRDWLQGQHWAREKVLVPHRLYSVKH